MSNPESKSKFIIPTMPLAKADRSESIIFRHSEKKTLNNVTTTIDKKITSVNGEIVIQYHKKTNNANEKYILRKPTSTSTFTIVTNKDDNKGMHEFSEDRDVSIDNTLNRLKTMGQCNDMDFATEYITKLNQSAGSMSEPKSIPNKLKNTNKGVARRMSKSMSKKLSQKMLQPKSKINQSLPKSR